MKIQFITTREPKWTHPDIIISDNIDKVIEMFKNTDIIGGDTENNMLNPIYATPLLSQFSDSKVSYVIDRTSVNCNWLSDYDDKLYLTFNGQYDYMIWKYHYKAELRRMVDLMINEQVLGRGSGRFNNLEATHLRRLNKYLPLPKSTRGSFTKMKYNPEYEIDHILYSAYDPHCLFEIYEVQKPFIDEYKLNKRIYDIAHPLIPILGDMCLEGFYLNKDLWNKTLFDNKQAQYQIECALDEELRKLAKGHQELTGGIWTRKRFKASGEQLDVFGENTSIENENNYNVSYSSTAQMIKFFSTLREPIPQQKNKKTYEMQNSFAEGALEQYKIEYPSSKMKVFINKLLEFKEVEKEINSFGDKFLKSRVPDKQSKKKFVRGYLNSITQKVHTYYKQEFTKNGRLASGDGRKRKGDVGIGLYNSQQIPKKNKYRNAFTLTPKEIADGWYIDTDDLTGAEGVILASQSQDPKLIEILNNPKLDLHCELATNSYTRIIRYIITNMNETRAYDELYHLLKVNRLQDSLKKKIGEDINGQAIVRDLTKDEKEQITQERIRSALLSNGIIITKKEYLDIREPYKNCTYGIFYGAQEGKIAETLNIAPFYAKLTIDGMRDTIPVAFAHMDKAARFGVKNGYIIFNEITNSRHWFQSWLEAKAQGRELTNSQRSEIERFCKNSIMSGTQADMIKEGMVNINNHIRQSFVAETIKGKLVDNVNDKFRWKLQVHDELVFAHRHNSFEEAEAFSKKICKIMTDTCNQYLKGEVKMKISSYTGICWNKDN